MIWSGHQPVNVSPTLKTITCVSPIKGELFALKASIDQVDDRAHDTQRKTIAGILFIYMPVLVFIISIGTTSLRDSSSMAQQTLGSMVRLPYVD